MADPGTSPPTPSRWDTSTRGSRHSHTIMAGESWERAKPPYRLLRKPQLLASFKPGRSKPHSAFTALVLRSVQSGTQAYLHETQISHFLSAFRVLGARLANPARHARNARPTHPAGQDPSRSMLHVSRVRPPKQQKAQRTISFRRTGIICGVCTNSIRRQKSQSSPAPPSCGQSRGSGSVRCVVERAESGAAASRCSFSFFNVLSAFIVFQVFFLRVFALSKEMVRKDFGQCRMRRTDKGNMRPHSSPSLSSMMKLRHRQTIFWLPAHGNCSASDSAHVRTLILYRPPFSHAWRCSRGSLG